MKFFSLLIILFLGGGLLLAQTDDPLSSTSSDVTWRTVSLVDYKPGKTGAAKEIIRKFESASRHSDTPTPHVYWLETGKYDLIVVWEMQEEPVDASYLWCPDESGWWNTFVTQEGSEEAAQKLQQDYYELIASSVTNVARESR